MSQILRCCSYYCLALALLGAIFFAILYGFELSKNEYLIETFQDGRVKKTQLASMLIVIGLNVGLFLFCLILVNKKPEE